MNSTPQSNPAPADTASTAGQAAVKADKHGRLVGNLSMFVAKTFSGFNENALKYLLPHWMNAFSGVVIRLGFGSLFFWILGWDGSSRGSVPTRLKK